LFLSNSEANNLVLYSNKDKFDSKDIFKHLEDNRITLKNYDDFYSDIVNFKQSYPDYKVVIHQGTCSFFVSNLIKNVKDLNFQEAENNSIEVMKVVF